MLLFPDEATTFPNFQRLMGFAAVAPPATLSVVSGWLNETKDTPWAFLDWTSPGWIDAENNMRPANSIFEAATQAAIDTTIVPITPPALNSSYRLQFYGPSLQCNAANSTQQTVFDNYTWTLAEDLPENALGNIPDLTVSTGSAIGLYLFLQVITILLASTLLSRLSRWVM
jgi:hypothetical protein